MKSLFSAMFVASSLIASTGVTAQTDSSMFTLPSTGTQEVTLSGAGSSDKDFDNNIFSLEGSYGWYLSEAAEVGVRQSVGIADSDGQDVNWSGSTRAFYDYHFGHRTRPYIGANLGYVYGDMVEESFLAGLELGIKHYVLERTFINGQIEYQYFFEDADEIDNRFDNGSFVYSVGLGFNF